MEHRIRATKRQISNLASNIDPDHVQLVNPTIEIKEKLYHATRKSHGVKIRSGRHEPRSDTNDYERLMKCLDETKAHIRKPGRCFGNYNFPQDLTSDKKFGKAAFVKKILLAKNDLHVVKRILYDTSRRTVARWPHKRH